MKYSTITDTIPLEYEIPSFPVNTELIGSIVRPEMNDEEYYDVEPLMHFNAVTGKAPDDIQMLQRN